MRFYKFAYKILASFFRLIFRIELSGSENEPRDEAFLACANHLSNWDVIILAVCLHSPVRFFAKAELFRIPLLKQLITALGAFPAQRGSADIGALKKAIQILQDGGIVGFFPQGKRYPRTDPRQSEPKHGVALISHRSSAKILPVCIQTKDYKIRPFRKVYVTIGKPIESDELNIDKGGKEQYEYASKYVFSKIVELIDDEKTNG